MSWTSMTMKTSKILHFRNFTCSNSSRVLELSRTLSNPCSQEIELNNPGIHQSHCFSHRPYSITASFKAEALAPLRHTITAPIHGIINARLFSCPPSFSTAAASLRHLSASTLSMQWWSGRAAVPVRDKSRGSLISPSPLTFLQHSYRLSEATQLVLEHISTAVLNHSIFTASMCLDAAAPALLLPSGQGRLLAGEQAHHLSKRVSWSLDTLRACV